MRRTMMEFTESRDEIAPHTGRMKRKTIFRSILWNTLVCEAVIKSLGSWMPAGPYWHKDIFSGKAYYIICLIQRKPAKSVIRLFAPAFTILQQSHFHLFFLPFVEKTIGVRHQASYITFTNISPPSLFTCLLDGRNCLSEKKAALELVIADVSRRP